MPSKLYSRALEEAKAHHLKSKTYSGKFLRPHKPFLTRLIREEGITSALDYGCGKGDQYHWIDPTDMKTLESVWGFEVTKYDPAYDPYSAEPEGHFDLVICTHTLGSIPLVDQRDILHRLFDYAVGFVYIAEKIGAVRKGVHGARQGFANHWKRDDWIELIQNALRTYDESPPRVILSTMDRVGKHKIVTRAYVGSETEGQPLPL